MASKKQPKDAGPKARTEAEKLPPPKKRNEVLNPALVEKYLGETGLPTDGTIEEQADRLEAFFEHEANKAGGDPASMLECLPSLREDDSVSDDALGCYRSAPSTIPECPFCGMTDTVTTFAPAAKESEKKSGKKGKAKKDDPVEDKVDETPIVEPENAPVAAQEGGKDALEEESSPEPAKASAAASEGLVKTNAKSIRKNKGKAGAAALMAPTLDVAEEAPGEVLKVDESIARSDAAASETVAPETENDSPPEGATVADLDRECARVTNAQGLAERTTALSMWEQGDAIQNIYERKLWCLERNHEDGSPVYKSFGEFTARKFDMSQATAYAYKRVVAIFDRATVEALGFSRMKELLSAQDLPASVLRSLVERALKRLENGSAFVLSSRELRDEVAKEKRLLVSPPPPVAPASTAKSSPVENNDPGAEDRDERAVDENDAAPPSNRVDHDDDGVVREDEEEGDRPRSRAAEPRTVTVSLSDTRFVIPLYRKGSNVKPAKKIEDGCHGSISGMNGTTMKVEVVIGEGAELQLVLTIDRPR
jgi:hypothetical protein